MVFSFTLCNGWHIRNQISMIFDSQIPQLCATTMKLLAAAIKIGEMLDFVGFAAAY